MATAVIDYDPMSLAQTEDPYAVYRRLRAEAPVHYCERYDLWIISKYADCSMIARDPARFSSLIATDSMRERYRAREEDRRGRVHTLLTADPPVHARYRTIVARPMSQRSVSAFEPRIQRIVDHVVADMAPAGRADLVELAFRIPMAVISTLLGIDQPDFDTFKRWSDASIELLSPGLSLETVEANLATLAGMQRFLADQVAEQRERPRGGLLQGLMEARKNDGEPLNDAELMSFFSTLFNAANETTAHLIAHTMLQLLRHPDAAAAVLASPAVAENAVDESLRLESSSQGLLRLTREDVEIRGVRIPSGSRLQTLFGSANRDEDVFEDPDRFDVHRTNAHAHLGFGAGPHFCIGAPLARLEVRIAVTTLLRRLPGLRLVPGQSFAHKPNFFVRGLYRLDVEWDREPGQ